MIVTVFWNDDNHGNKVQDVEVRERSDGKIYEEGLVRQAMRQHGYSEDEINIAIKRYFLVNLI